MEAIVEDAGDVVVGELVDHLLSAALGDDQILITKDAQLMRERGLFELADLLELGDRHGPVGGIARTTALSGGTRRCTLAGVRTHRNRARHLGKPLGGKMLSIRP